MSKEREDAMDAASWGTFVVVCPNKPTPKTKEEGVQGQSPHINKVVG